MKPIHSGALAATVMIALHASAAAAQSSSGEPALAVTAVALPPTSLSVDEAVRLHLAVTSLITYPTPDALATIQEIRGLMIARLAGN